MSLGTHTNYLKYKFQTFTDLLDGLFAYARANLVLINVFVRDPYATYLIRDEEFPTIVFVAGFGGLLGVFTGKTDGIFYSVVLEIVLVILLPA